MKTCYAQTDGFARRKGRSTSSNSPFHGKKTLTSPTNGKTRSTPNCSSAASSPTGTRISSSSKSAPAENLTAPVKISRTSSTTTKRQQRNAGNAWSAPPYAAASTSGHDGTKRLGRASPKQPTYFDCAECVRPWMDTRPSRVCEVSV
eukprot:PhF_6_TR31499/c0_g1_i1/m.46356